MTFVRAHKSITLPIIIAALVMSSSLASAADSSSSNQPRMSNQNSVSSFDSSMGSAQDAYQDMRKTVGFVPEFMKAYPERSIAGAWNEFKSVFLNPNTALPGKFKELIGLAVASQVPCHYCVYAHQKFAKLNRANEKQIQESVALAAATRQWSTILNGLQVDEMVFRKDTDRMLSNLDKKQQAGTAASSMDTHNEQNSNRQTSESSSSPSRQAVQDIQATFGFMPQFLQAIPSSALPGAWNDFKSLELAQTEIPSKYKSLIDLGVSAQIPCHYCVYFDNKSAQMNGASTTEINEALTVASLTRKWSTVVNGMQVNESKFHSDIDRIVKNMQNKMNSQSQLGGQAAPEVIRDSRTE